MPSRQRRFALNAQSDRTVKITVLVSQKTHLVSGADFPIDNSSLSDRRTIVNKNTREQTNEQPEWNEAELRKAIHFTGEPGVRCDGCNHPDNIPWQHGRIFHPAGRPCHARISLGTEETTNEG